MGPVSIDDLLSLSMNLRSEAMVTQHMIREKVHLMKREMSKMAQDVVVAQNQLSAANAQIVELEQQAKSLEERAARLEKELDDVRVKLRISKQRRRRLR